MKSCAVFVLFLVLPIVSHAQVITYDESADGDIDGSPTFVLSSAGSNTFSGSSSYSDSGFDSDTFNLNLDPSLQITDAVWSVTNATQTNIDLSVTFGFNQMDTVQQLQFFWHEIGTGGDTLDTYIAAPYDFTNYVVGTGAQWRSRSSPWSASWDWDVTIVTAAAVPEPSTYAVVAFSILGACFLVRWRKVQTSNDRRSSCA